MDVNELSLACELAIHDEDIARQRYLRIHLKKSVLFNFQRLLEQVNYSGFGSVEYLTFFVKNSFGNQSFRNFGFEDEYDYFLIVCDVTREICQALNIFYQFQVYDDWRLDHGTLQSGMMVKQVVSLVSLKQMNFRFFDRKLEKIIQRRNLADIGDYI